MVGRSPFDGPYLFFRKLFQPGRIFSQSPGAQISDQGGSDRVAIGGPAPVIQLTQVAPFTLQLQVTDMNPDIMSVLHLPVLRIMKIIVTLHRMPIQLLYNQLIEGIKPISTA